MPENKNLKQTLWILLALTGLTILVFWPATGFDFINYDDPDYVTYNGVVTPGLSWNGILWAFETHHASNWHPLTWISHMMDCSLFGTKPGGHHLTNILFHTANTCLVFLGLKRLTGKIWRSALVAALFSWHPLRAESVAWISERKDVLSAFFGLLSLYCYAGYARRPQTSGSFLKNKDYLRALIFFGCALLAKPMLVTLPMVFLLLDFWPLQRFTFCQGGPATTPAPGGGLTLKQGLLEKIPFIALSLLDSVMTFWAQHENASVVSTVSLPVIPRFSNVLVSYVRYLGKMFWPKPLAIPYPFSHEWTLVETCASLALLLMITMVALRLWKSRPYLLVGWLWFLGMLVPVIGLVQVGMQSMADRYTYLPGIGILCMLVWLIPENWFAWRQPGLLFCSVTSAVLVFYATMLEQQLVYWQNSITLFLHTTLVTKDNILAEYNLAEALTRSKLVEDGVEHYKRALAIKPNRVEAQYNSQTQAHYNLGIIYRVRRQWKEAEEQFRAFTRLEPMIPSGHINLGVTCLALDHTKEGLAEFQLAYGRGQFPKDEVEIRVLGAVDSAYAESGQWDKAFAALENSRDAAMRSGKKDFLPGIQRREAAYREVQEKCGKAKPFR